MSDADNRATCGNCGLPILDGEAVDWTPFPPKRLCHATHADCFARLRADLAAALRVVRAARLLRVRRWQVNRRAEIYRRAIHIAANPLGAGALAAALDAPYAAYRFADRACRSAERAYDAALTAYVKEGAR